MASQIISLTIVYSVVYSGADQRKHQRSVSLAFVRGIHRWPVNSPHNHCKIMQTIKHCNDVIMIAMASQITSLAIVCSVLYSGADQRKYQRSASLAFVRGIHRWPVNSPHKGPVTRKNISIWWRHHERHETCVYNFPKILKSSGVLRVMFEITPKGEIFYDRFISTMGFPKSVTETGIFTLKGHVFCSKIQSDCVQPWSRRDMMTSSNGNIFRVTGHLYGEFTGPRWIPRTKASDAELWCFLWSTSV